MTNKHKYFFIYLFMQFFVKVFLYLSKKHCKYKEKHSQTSKWNRVYFKIFCYVYQILVLFFFLVLYFILENRLHESNFPRKKIKEKTPDETSYWFPLNIRRSSALKVSNDRNEWRFFFFFHYIDGTKKKAEFN